MNNVAIRSTAVLLSLVGVIGAGCAQVRGPMYGPGHAAKTPEECQRIMDEHRRLMERRAAERGMPMQPPPEAACPAR